MLDIFITIDTELWDFSPDPSPKSLHSSFDQLINGICADGEWGIPYQIDTLAKHGLKAVFFLESLMTPVVCPDQSRKLVSLIGDNGHDTEIHLHTEWLSLLSDNSLPQSKGKHIRHYTDEEQFNLIARCIDNLKAIGVESPSAFRAGNFGANSISLRALARNSILFDTSYNQCYIDDACRIPNNGIFIQPEMRDGVYEFPVMCFRDYPNHLRPLHLQACSFDEIKHVLLSAYHKKWKSCVIVTHSFETLNSKRNGRDPIVCKRLELLCEFLSENSDKFRTLGFSDIVNPDNYCHSTDLLPPISSPLRTIRRFTEQLQRRIQF